MNEADFFEFIYGPSEGGVVGLAVRFKDGKFKEQFYEWPRQKDKVITVTRAKERGDIYFRPALLSTTSSKKANVLGSCVAWVDLDGHDTPHDGPWAASVASGSPGHVHGYVSAGGFLAPRNLEIYNRFLTKEFQGDRSGWDANQLLRVPNTLNWKTDPPKPVKLLQLDPTKLWIPPNPEDIPPPATVEIPQVDIATVLLDNDLPARLRNLLTQHPIECFDRSAGLYQVAAIAAEAGLDPGSVYAITAYADSKWGKFTGRDDKELRLTEIVRRVFDGRLTVTDPLAESSESTKSGNTVGWFDLAESEEQVEWVVENFVRKNGLTILVGPTKSGKSTLALGLTAKIVAGARDFLGFPIMSDSERILYASLEMDKFALNYFLKDMSKVLAPLRERLNEQARFLAVGHSIPLDLPEGQKKYEHELSGGNYTGLVIDTLGASVSTSLSDEKVMRAIVDWCERARQKYNIWIVILHHPRKPPTQGKHKHEYTSDDMYGARLIGDRADASFLLDSTQKNQLILRNLNSRFGPKLSDMNVYRTADGWIERGSNEGEFYIAEDPVDDRELPGMKGLLD